ncbi:nitroreductase family protein [Acetobacterium sp.]|uniref:nitroreductase family protein n=1 Tax=Acetobacterium sp. TaxID=1872094 RepID=UPI00359441EA
MKFREFTVNSHSTREFVDSGVEERNISEIKAYLDKVNSTVGKEKGFSLILMENGAAVYQSLDGSGGYGGVMIKAPHYIGLRLDKADHEVEVFGAFYMQSAVKKLYDLDLGSCWITMNGISQTQEDKLLAGQAGIIEHLLAFGKPAKKEGKTDKHKTVINCDTKYEQNPYGITMITTNDEARLSVVDTIFLHTWGNVAPFSEMEKRGVLDLLYYVRNSPSFQNIQPCRLILKDGYAELAVVNPDREENYTDAGIMLFTLEGLAKEMSFPSNWHFIKDDSGNTEYRRVAHFDL